MSIMINCDNKKCMKNTAANLNTTSDEVICEECNQSIKNVTIFTKRQLKQFGQTIKHKKVIEPYSIKCEHCEAEATPSMKNDKFYCSTCKKELMKISQIFRNTLKEALKTCA